MRVLVGGLPCLAQVSSAAERDAVVVVVVGGGILLLLRINNLPPEFLDAKSGRPHGRADQSLAESGQRVKMNCQVRYSTASCAI